MASRRSTLQKVAEALGVSVDARRMRVCSKLDRAQIRSAGGPPEASSRLDVGSSKPTSAKEETISILKEQLEAEREAHRETRHALAELVQRIPELEAAAQAQNKPQGGSEDADWTPGRHDTPPAQEEPPKRRPWWKKMFDTRDKSHVTRDTLKVHLELFRHITTLVTAISVVLLVLGENFELVRPFSAFGVVALALTLLLGVLGLMLTTYFVRDQHPARIEFWVSEGLVLLTCSTFLASVVTVLDGALQQYGLGFFGWLRWAFGG